MARQNAEVWSSTEETSSPKRKSRSYDDLLADEHCCFSDTQNKSESMVSLLCADNSKGDSSLAWASPYSSEAHGSSRSRAHLRFAHDAPGFLKLYKRTHCINRKDLLNSEVICFVKSRVLQYEKEQHKSLLHGWKESSTEEVPRDMVPNRIFEFEKLIQKSKSMPNLGEEALSTVSFLEHPKNGFCTMRCFSVESLLDEENQNRHTTQVQKNYKSNTLVPIHIEVTSEEPQRSQMDYSDSDQDGVVSDMSDFIQIEGSSFCSESDFDYFSFTSSESFYGSGHHHHHKHLISSCKGRFPASYTRFTTMLKHARVKQETTPEDPKRQHSDAGLSPKNRLKRLNANHLSLTPWTLLLKISVTKSKQRKEGEACLTIVYCTDLFLNCFETFLKGIPPLKFLEKVPYASLCIHCLMMVLFTVRCTRMNVAKATFIICRYKNVFSHLTVRYSFKNF